MESIWSNKIENPSTNKEQFVLSLSLLGIKLKFPGVLQICMYHLRTIATNWHYLQELKYKYTSLS